MNSDCSIQFWPARGSTTPHSSCQGCQGKHTCIQTHTVLCVSCLTHTSSPSLSTSLCLNVSFSKRTSYLKCANMSPQNMWFLYFVKFDWAPNQLDIYSSLIISFLFSIELREMALMIKKLFKRPQRDVVLWCDLPHRVTGLLTCWHECVY